MLKSLFFASLIMVAFLCPYGSGQSTLLSLLSLSPAAQEPVPKWLQHPFVDIQTTYHDTETLSVHFSPPLIPTGKPSRTFTFQTGKDDETIHRLRDVRVEDGHLLLSGPVKWHGQKATYTLHVFSIPASSVKSMTGKNVLKPGLQGFSLLVSSNGKTLFRRGTPTKPFPFDAGGVPPVIQAVHVVVTPVR